MRTANQCRSPMAEAFTRAALDGADHAIEVASAGTAATADMPMAEVAARALAVRGRSLPGFRASRIDPDLVAASDLILCATRDSGLAEATEVTNRPKIHPTGDRPQGSNGASSDASISPRTE